MNNHEVLLVFNFLFFLFFFLLHLGGSSEAFISDSDSDVKSGVGSLDGGGEVGRECLVVSDVCELFNSDCQRFNS